MLEGGTCPVCNEYFKPNGTGNEGAKFTHWILEKMPWDEILQDEAVPIHDWRCHIGEYEYNTTFEETTNEFKQNIEHAMYRWIEQKWWRRYIFKPALKKVDEIYAFAVGNTQTGRDAFDSNSCKNP